ncbi:MAG: CoA transferase [Chloroflexi bacterium]|nr:CoA transferase [Chloroflexota bacterium]
MPLPLEGVRILAVSQYGAGPFGMMHLGDFGADVIKVEDPATKGDVARAVPPFTAGNDSLFFQSLNRNNRSIALDLRSPAGRAVFDDLVRVCDAVFNNLRGDLPAKLRLDYAGLKHLNPRVVCCSLSGFGKTGPRAAEPGYDYLGQGLAGLMSITGEPDAPPARFGSPIIDFAGGWMAALGTMIALFQSQRTGIGCDVDVALLDTALTMLNYMGTYQLNRDFKVERISDSAHPTMVPCQVFPTSDSYVIVMCLKEKFWQLLCELIDRPELAADPRFLTFKERYDHRDELIPELKSVFRRHTTAEWLDRLQGQIPCAPVNDVEEALREPQILARDMIVSWPHPEFGEVKTIGNPIKISDAPPRYEAGPAYAAHTDQVLRELLGYSDDRLAELRAARAVE